MHIHSILLLTPSSVVNVNAALCVWISLPHFFPSFFSNESIKVAGWENAAAEQAMGAVKDVIHAARSLRAQYNLAPQVSMCGEKMGPCSHQTDAM